MEGERDDGRGMDANIAPTGVDARSSRPPRERRNPSRTEPRDWRNGSGHTGTDIGTHSAKAKRKQQEWEGGGEEVPRESVNACAGVAGCFSGRCGAPRLCRARLCVCRLRGRAELGVAMGDVDGEGGDDDDADDDGRGSVLTANAWRRTDGRR